VSSAMKKIQVVLLILIAGMLTVSGCAMIAGKEDDGAPLQPSLNISFVETLRNAKSLQGESYRDASGATDPAGSLQHPGSVYADQFRVYVVDTSPSILPSPGRIFIFDRGDRKLTKLDGTSSPLDEVKLLAPAGIVVDAVGTIYVSDAQQGRVFGYDGNGKLLWLLGRATAITSKQGLGDFASPAGMAVDNSKNRIYVADKHAHQVKVFSNMGSHLFDIGNSGKAGEDFKFPEAVALDQVGNIHVLDTQRLRVFTLTAEGGFLRSFSLKNAATPGVSVRPKGIAIDSDGHVYVVDAVNNNVLIFNPDGTFLYAWGRTGTLPGDFWTPTGIFIDSHDVIYVADQTNSRVQVFQYTKQ